MTAPEDREALAECDCGHPLWWHHETKGCMSNHHGGRLCWCQVHPDVLLARVKRYAAVEALRGVADEWTQDGLSNVLLPKPTPPAVPVIVYANRVGDWLRDRIEEARDGDHA